MWPYFIVSSAVVPTARSLFAPFSRLRLQEGRILVDGVPLTDLNLRSLHRKTAIVAQDTQLFATRYARKDSTLGMHWYFCTYGISGLRNNSNRVCSLVPLRWLLRRPFRGYCVLLCGL